MKTEPVFTELRLHTVPCESLVYSDNERLRVFADDINEKRWEITFFCMECFRIISMDLGYNYNSKDFEKYGYIENDCRYFRKHIMEIKDSKWIEELKRQGNLLSDVMNELEKSKHFLVPFYDYQLEVIAQKVEVKRVDDQGSCNSYIKNTNIG